MNVTFCGKRVCVDIILNPQRVCVDITLSP